MLPAISGRLFCAYEPRITLVFSLMHCDMMSKAPRVVLKCGAMLRIILKHSATLEKYPKCFCQSRADAPVTYCWLPAVGFMNQLLGCSATGITKQRRVMTVSLSLKCLQKNKQTCRRVTVSWCFTGCLFKAWNVLPSLNQKAQRISALWIQRCMRVIFMEVSSQHAVFWLNSRWTKAAHTNILMSFTNDANI